MRLTQGAFSFLPDLSDEQITKQVKYCLDNGWAVNVEYTDDPHPRNSYWEMWGHPMFDLKDPAGVMPESELMATEVPDLGLYSADVDEIGTDQKIELARRAEEAALAADPKRLERSGQVLVSAQLALDYGFCDVDGARPRPLNEANA